VQQNSCLRYDTLFLMQLTDEEIEVRRHEARTREIVERKDKNDLVLALTEPVLEDVRKAAIRPFDRSAAPTLGELQAELRANFDIYRPHIPLLNALVELSYSDPAVREVFQQGFEDVHGTIAAHIAKGQRAGFVRPDIFAAETAAWITWMAERGMSQLVAGADPRRLDRLAKSLATMVWLTVYDVDG